jgi:hypothetical protein
MIDKMELIKMLHSTVVETAEGSEDVHEEEENFGVDLKFNAVDI